MPSVHVVEQGECLSEIARKYGFLNYKAVYEHPDNADLRKKRPNPNVLMPGDEVAIPDIASKKVAAVTNKNHKFQIKLPRKVLRVVFKGHDGKPLKDTEYTLRFGEQTKIGKTDGSGKIDEPVPMGTRVAEIEIAGRALTLRLGHLNPIGQPGTEDGDDDFAGVQARLKNLGYDAGPTDGIYGRRTRAAIAMFQAEHGLDIDGKANDATLAKLDETYAL
jgi:N-acetylmuramoyl-L-alanine amidase